MLQSKAGYIDARPLTASSAKPLATHGRTIHPGQNAKNSERTNDFRFAPNIRRCSAAQFSGENHLRLNSFPPDAQQRLTILPRTGPAAPTLRRLRTTPYGPRVATIGPLVASIT